MPNPQSYNYYINWALYAITGRLQEADNLMKSHGTGIRSIAKHFQKTKKPRIHTLYRGLLLDPEQVEEKSISQDPNVTFVSFSEDRDVACWFADPSSVMSSFVKQHRPRVEGWIMEYTPKLTDILFHHSWNPIPIPGVGRVYLERAAEMHPDIIDVADQLAWNLQTQSEVIVKPLRAGTPVEAYELSDCPPGLDERLTLPSMRGRF
jgi:hypothetical protein